MPWYVAWALTLENGRLGCIYSPQHNSSRWRKVVALCGTPDSPVVHRTTHCLLPVRLAIALTEQVTVGVAGFHTGQSSGLLSVCHLELAVGARVPGAPDSPVHLAQTVRGQHVFISWTSLRSS
jgi:hypothetical protein